MSSVPSESDPLEATLESARRNIRQLEMDTYRVRTDLTRLEVALEAVMNRDSESTAAGASPADVETPPAAAFELIDSQPTTVDPSHAFGDSTAVEEERDASPLEARGGTEVFESAPESLTHELEKPSADGLLGPKAPKNATPVFKLATQPVFASLALHGAVILAIVSISVAAVVHSGPAFTTTILDLGEKPAEHSGNFDLGQLAALDTSNVGAPDATQEPLQASPPGPLVNDVVPVDFESAAVGPPNEGEAGLIGPPSADDGTMPVGEGGSSAKGSGKPTGSGNGQKKGGGGGSRSGGPSGSALFFGTQTKGDRFVFVVDNSSSMKNGRFEMAIAELVKTVEGLSPRQSFYVIFVSDQPYPMFYPQPEPALIPATTQNKNRLREWLPKAILASGHNRELIKAMDMAAALRPQAVYLLWDGDLKYSDTVRMDVMNHLTAPYPGNFVVHTVGLGITSLDGEQNLAAIAQAHHGVYRPVEVPKIRSR